MRNIRLEIDNEQICTLIEGARRLLFDMVEADGEDEALYHVYYTLLESTLGTLLESVKKLDAATQAALEAAM